MRDVEINCYQCGKTVAVLRIDGGRLELFDRMKCFKCISIENEGFIARVLCFACAEKEEKQGEGQCL